MTANCPLCGSQLPEIERREALVHIPMSTYQRRLVELLARRATMPMAQLVELFYADDPNGGPLNPETSLWHRINAVRGLLKPYGWTIHNPNRGRGNGAVLSLKRLEQKW